MSKKKELKPKLEAKVENSAENQEVKQVETAETEVDAEESKEKSQEAEEQKAEFETEEVESQKPEREITEYDMLVMEDTGMGLAKTSLKVKVNRVSPFIREKIVIDDNQKDTVQGWGEDYILLSATNAYPRLGLKRGQIITCI